MIPIIYAYHVPIQEIDQREANKQIELWQKSWTAAGWKPTLLNMSHASLFRRFREITPRLMRRPTSNPRSYEIACFHRWMAVASLGGGWMCDYDVLNLGFKPVEPVSEHLTGLAQACPCFVHGSEKNYQDMVNFFDLTGKDVEERGVQHYSDQVAFGQAIEAGLVDVYNAVSNYPGPGQDILSKLVHVKTDHAIAAGMPKSAIMAKLLETAA